MRRGFFGRILGVILMSVQVAGGGQTDSANKQGSKEPRKKQRLQIVVVEKKKKESGRSKSPDHSRQSPTRRSNGGSQLDGHEF